MHYSDFQILDVVCDISENGYAHNEQIEFYILHLSEHFLLLCPIHNIAYLLLLLLLFAHLQLSRLFLSLLLAQSHRLCDLF